MKKYTYTGTSIFSFSFEGVDYVIFGNGPHSLPAKCPLVKQRLKQGILKIKLKALKHK